MTEKANKTNKKMYSLYRKLCLILKWDLTLSLYGAPYKKTRSSAWICVRNNTIESLVTLYVRLPINECTLYLLLLFCVFHKCLALFSFFIFYKTNKRTKKKQFSWFMSFEVDWRQIKYGIWNALQIIWWNKMKAYKTKPNHENFSMWLIC